MVNTYQYISRNINIALIVFFFKKNGYYNKLSDSTIPRSHQAKSTHRVNPRPHQAEP